MVTQEPSEQDELLRKQEEEQRVRFEDISITAAWIAASYHAYSPETIRGNIQEEWVNKIINDLAKNEKFADIYQAKRKNESRREFNQRQAVSARKAAQIRTAVQNLVGEHGDQLFTKHVEVQNQIKKSLAETIQQDLPEIQPHKEELLEAIDESQTNIADTFKEQNDKNNARYNKGGIYRRKETDLEKIQQTEKAEHLSNLVVQRAFKPSTQELFAQKQISGQAKNEVPNKDKKQIKTQNDFYKKALFKVFNSVNPKSLTEAEFSKLVYIEVNKILNNRRDQRRFRSFNRDQKEINKQINKLTRYWSHYFKILQPETEEVKTTEQEPIQEEKTVPDDNIKTFTPLEIKNKENKEIQQIPEIEKQTKKIPKLDLSRINQAFKQFLSQLYQSISTALSSLNEALAQIPRVGSFFGGGSGESSESRVGNFIKSRAKSGAKSLLKKGAKAGAKQAIKAAATGLGESAIAAAAPVLIVVGIVILVIIGIFIFMHMSKNINTVTKPQAIIENEQQIN